jgi:hypothetical protein
VSYRRSFLDLEEELETGKIGIDFDVLFFCPADSEESRDCDGHFPDGDLAAQKRRSRNHLLTQKTDPAVANILNATQDRWFYHAAEVKRRALLSLDVQCMGKSRIPPAIGLHRSFHKVPMITRVARSVKSSNGLVRWD